MPDASGKNRMPLMQAALARHDPNSLSLLLEQAVQVDGSIKGFAGGKPWDNLEGLVTGPLPGLSQTYLGQWPYSAPLCPTWPHPLRLLPFMSASNSGLHSAPISTTVHIYSIFWGYYPREQGP